MKRNQVKVGLRVKVNNTFEGSLTKTKTREGTIVSLGPYAKNIVGNTVIIALDGYKKTQEWSLNYLDLVEEVKVETEKEKE